jgi:hypothetical protein
LCKTPSNTFLPQFNIMNNKLNSFEYEDIIENQNIMPIFYFIENVLSFYNKSQVLLNDFNKNPDLIYSIIIHFFSDCFYLVDILRNDNYIMVLELIKKFILCLRVLIKNKLLNVQYFEKRYLVLKEYWKLTDLKAIDLIKTLFHENLILIKLLSNDIDAEKYNEFYYNYYPMIITQIYSKKLLIDSNFFINNENNVDKLRYFLSSEENLEFIKKHFIFFLRKIMLIRNDIGVNYIKEIFTDVNHEYTYYYESMGISTDLQYFIDKITVLSKNEIDELLNQLILINTKGKYY